LSLKAEPFHGFQQILQAFSAGFRCSRFTGFLVQQHKKHLRRFTESIGVVRLFTRIGHRSSRLTELVVIKAIEAKEVRGTRLQT
jgi:hypothetical protein